MLVLADQEQNKHVLLSCARYCTCLLSSTSMCNILRTILHNIPKKHIARTIIKTQNNIKPKQQSNRSLQNQSNNQIEDTTTTAKIQYDQYYRPVFPIATSTADENPFQLFDNTNGFQQQSGFRLNWWFLIRGWKWSHRLGATNSSWKKSMIVMAVIMKALAVSIMVIKKNYM